MAGRAAAMRPARERRLAGPRRPGKAARGALAAGEPPVLPGPPRRVRQGELIRELKTLCGLADSPAYCRLPVGANARLLALSRGLPYRATEQLGDNIETIEGTASGERRYKVRPAPRTGPQRRPGAATAGRGGGANGRQGRRRQDAGYAAGSAWPFTWSFKAAGLACAQAQVRPASAS